MAAADLTKPVAARPVATVVFDFGGVLLDWDPRHLYQKIFADPTEMEWFLANVCTGDWNEAQDKGRPWPEAEAEAMARHPKYTAQIRAFRARWIEMVASPIHGTVEVLETIAARGVPLYAITNFAADTLREARAKYVFFHHFHGIVVSGEVGILKPDAAIFQRLAADYKLDLTTCLFIDDVPKNVAGARAAGMAAVRFENPQKLRTDLAAHGMTV